jgi:hypothetical protein
MIDGDAHFLNQGFERDKTRKSGWQWVARCAEGISKLTSGFRWLSPRWVLIISSPVFLSRRSIQQRSCKASSFPVCLLTPFPFACAHLFVVVEKSISAK